MDGVGPWAFLYACICITYVSMHIFTYRLQILQNIGAVFVKMGQYSDAMTSYEHVMSEKPSVKAGQYIKYILLSTPYTHVQTL